MAELPAVFKESDHGKMGFDPIPREDDNGDIINYPVNIVKSELKKNKSSEGQHLAMQLKVQDGKAKGRVLFVRLNLVNKNADAVRIANNELAEICRACGKPSIKDSDELHGIDFFVQVKVIEETDTDPASNAITKYLHKSDVKKGIFK